MTLAYLAALVLIAASLSILMAGAFLVQQRTGNSGWVDTIWTFSLGLVGSLSALWPIAGSPPNARQCLVAALVAVWSLRLGIHIAIRTAGISDDPRYAEHLFDIEARFDRIVSVETFEHMMNWRDLLIRVRARRSTGCAISMRIARRSSPSCARSMPRIPR